MVSDPKLARRVPELISDPRYSGRVLFGFVANAMRSALSMTMSLAVELLVFARIISSVDWLCILVLSSIL